MFFDRGSQSFDLSENHMTHLGKNKDINTRMCGVLMLFDQLMKSLAGLLELASEQKESSQDTLNNPFRSFLSQPSFENADAIVKHCESTPLFAVHLGEKSPELKAREDDIMSLIQMSLDSLERKILEKMSPNQPKVAECKHSLFKVNPKFIYGVSPSLFENYKKVLGDKFGCDMVPNFDLVYQFLNFKAVLGILNDESQEMNLSSGLLKLIMNIFDSILNGNLGKTDVQEISSYFEVFFDGLKEYMEHTAREGSTLYWRVMRRISPLQIFSAFLFSYVDDPTVTARPLIFPKSRLYIFNETNFSDNGEGNVRNFSFKNEDMKEGYQAASVIVVYKSRDKDYSGFAPLIRLNNSEMYTICGVHINGESKIDSFYPLSKHFPFEEWFRFNDESIIKFDISMLLHLLHNSSEKGVFTIYEKIMDTEDADMEKNSADRANLSKNPASVDDQSCADRT